MVKTRVQFLTVDGVLLRGDLFAVEGIENGPAVVMTQGVSSLSFMASEERLTVRLDYS